MLVQLVMLDQIGQDSYVIWVRLVNQSSKGQLGQINQVRLDRLGQFRQLVQINLLGQAVMSIKFGQAN